MWGWDPSQGEEPVGGVTPTLLPSPNVSSPTPPPADAHPIVVPDVQDLKQQFQQQQSLLAHIKETIRENDAERSSREKQLEMYANKLSQIKSRSKNSQKKRGESPRGVNRKSSKENISEAHSTKTPVRTEESRKSTPKAKMSELKKCLEANKLKFEEQTEKGIFETKKIESMVEQLRNQVQERHLTINELQKTMDTPPAASSQTLPRRHKDKPVRSTKSTQTSKETNEAEDKIRLLEATIVDLEDTLKQQASVIAARTQAVTLLSEDLSKKGKSTVDELEETRHEMRTLQNNFVVIESQLKTDLLEKDNRLATLEEKIRELETTNELLREANNEVEERFRNAEKAATAKESSSIENVGDDNSIISELQMKVEELTKELDDSNKLMIRLKLEHKNKLKAANKALDKMKQSTTNKDEGDLSSKVVDLEAVIEKLEAKITEMEEEKAAAKDNMGRISDLENLLKQKDSEIASFEQLVATFEGEKLTWQQAFEDQNILVDNLNTRIQCLQTETSNMEPFEIPGEKAVKHFELSNQNVQSQIENLVLEKQELLSKLKSLSGVSSTDSLTFEKIDVNAMESDAQVQESDAHHIVELRQTLAAEREKSADFERKIEELENKIGILETLNSDTSKQKGGNNVRNKLRKLENELTDAKQALCVEKERVKELNEKLEDKENVILKYTEKESWDTDWPKDELENFGETQRKCLSLENNLLELTEHCERLRKENIEVVHQLSEEKVRRKRLEDELEAMQTIRTMATTLEERVAYLESLTPDENLEDKLEYCNIVIAGKDTEIFNLQSEVADRTQALEELREQLQEALTTVGTLQADCARLKGELTQQNAYLAGSKEREDMIKRLQDDISEHTWKITNLSAENHSLIEENEKLQKGIRLANEQVAELNEVNRRLGVSMETVMADAAVGNQEKNAALQSLRNSEIALNAAKAERTKLEQLLTESKETFMREQDEYMLRAEEAEKVLQKTWDERNELIQSRESILERLAAAEITLMDERKELQAVKNELANLRIEAVNNQEIINRLKNEFQLKNKELEGKQQDMDALTVKAKKFAANLKKKTQVEKEMIEKLNGLTVERDCLLEQIRAGQEMTEKWTTEGNEKQELMQQNEAILQENENLRRQLDMISDEKNAIKEESKLLESKLNDLISESHELQASMNRRIEEIETEKKAFALSVATITDKYEKECVKNASLDKKYLDTRNQLEALEQALQLEGQENEALLNDRALLLKERDSLLQRCEEMEALVRDRAALVEERDSLLQECKDNDVFLSDRNVLVGERDSLLQRCEEMEALVKDRAALVEERDSLLQECKDNDVFLSDRNVLVGERDSLLQRCEEMEALVKDRAAQVEERDSLLQECKEKDGTLEELQRKNSKLLETVEDQRQSLARALDDEIKLREKVQSEKLIVEGEKLKVSSLESQNQHLATAVEEVREALRLSNQELALMHDETNSTIEELRNERQALSQRCHDNELERINLMKSLEASQSRDNAETEESLFELHKTIKELQTALEALREKKDGEIFQIDYRCRMLGQENIEYRNIIQDLKNQLNELVDEKSQKDEPGDDQKNGSKKKKSVTFVTDRDDYIKQLREEVIWLKTTLDQRNKEFHNLQDTLAHSSVAEVTFKVQNQPNVEIPSTSTSHLFSEEKVVEFPLGLTSNSSDGNDPFSEESLTWDDAWGTEGHLEEEHEISKVNPLTDKVATLEREVKACIVEKEGVEEELRVQQVKYSKVLKKLKEQKLVIDHLSSEVKTAKQSAGGGDLDAAIMDELREEITRIEKKESETRKELELVKLERESLLKRIDVLNAGNEKFLEMKERQDGDVSLWQTKNAELRAEIVALQNKLEAGPVDDNSIAAENRSLRNEIEGLEWKISELTESIEEKDEELLKLRENRELPSANSDLNINVDQLQSELATARKETESLETTLTDLEQQLGLLASENETLQEILNNQKLGNNSVQNIPVNQPAPMFTYFQSSPASELFPETASASAELSNPGQSNADVEEQLKEKQKDVDKYASERNMLMSEVENLKSVLLGKENEIAQLLSQKTTETNELKHQVNVLNHNLFVNDQALGAVTSRNETISEELAFYKQNVEEKEQELSRLLQTFISPDIFLELKEEKLTDEEQIRVLKKTVHDLELAYKDSKIEIERLLNEERIRSDSPLEAELSNAKRMIEAEKSKNEALLQQKELESLTLRETLEREYEEERTRTENTIQQLKIQLRELDSETSHSTEEKEAQIRELAAECEEIRELCAVRNKDLTLLRQELENRDREIEISKELSIQIEQLRNSLLEKEAELTEMRQTLNNLSYVQQCIAERDGEIVELKRRLGVVSEERDRMNANSQNAADMVPRLEAEVRERNEEISGMKETLENLRAEIVHFRNFEKQVQDLQVAQSTASSDVRTSGVSLEQFGSVVSEEVTQRLQNDLDTALYMLHQRDVRCEELTFELVQLLEERDTLQLRLSNAIRINEGMRVLGEVTPLTSPMKERPSSPADPDPSQLAEKISELHNVGYTRDKNIQDESLQRHRDQMSLLGKGKSSPQVLDV